MASNIEGYPNKFKRDFRQDGGIYCNSLIGEHSLLGKY